MAYYNVSEGKTIDSPQLLMCKLNEGYRFTPLCRVV